MGITNSPRSNNNISLKSSGVINQQSNQAIKNCQKCSSLGHSHPEGPYIQVGKGLGQNIMLVAESPAPNGWRLSGKAFYTPEGKLLATGKRLNAYLEKFGLSISDVSFTELCKCYIDNRKLLEKSCENCSEHLQSQLEEIKPSLVITLGVTPNKVFAKNHGIEAVMGQLQEVDEYKYLPLYHPSPASPTGHKNNLEILENLDPQLQDILADLNG